MRQGWEEGGMGASVGLPPSSQPCLPAVIPETRGSGGHTGTPAVFSPPIPLACWVLETDVSGEG